MPFRTLYHRRQAASDVEPLSWYVADAEELSWVSRIYIKRSAALAKTHLRGLVIWHKNGFIPSEPTANYTIVVAHGLTPREERFVVIKELMHIYFGPEGGGVATSSEIELENLIDELFSGSTMKSKQGIAELRAAWMAMAVLVREKDRRAEADKVAQLDGAAKSQMIDDLGARWRITSRQVTRIFSDRYKQELEKLVYADDDKKGAL